VLRLHVLNVGNGDSLLLQFTAPDGESRFGVIDCNTGQDGTIPVLTRLGELGAQRLAFVLLTHPHMDHFTGMYSVLDAFRGRIDAFYSFPIGLHVPGRIKQLAKAYCNLQKPTDSRVVRRGILEFIKILHFAKEELFDNWTELTGPQSTLMLPGFDGVHIYVLGPLPKVKGEYFQAIEKGDIAKLAKAEQENQYSVALRIEYANKSVILGGDATFESWLAVAKQWSNTKQSYASHVVKMPHHGSRRDCPPPVVEKLFQTGDKPVAIFSADGRRHPDDETYADILARGVLPYCTNLAARCGAKGKTRVKLPEVSADLSRYIEVVQEEPSSASKQVCQGHITMNISPAGEITMETQYGTFCSYRSVEPRILTA
jgi:beta-lactamase superfamily II metal-dependent hydrolase